MSVITKKQKQQFLKTLVQTGNVTKAAKAGKHPRCSWYKLRNEDEVFAQEWMDALDEGLDELEAKLFERGKNGESDTAAIFLLKAHRPETYREHGVIEHTGQIKHDHEHRTLSETDSWIEGIVCDGEESALPEPSTH